MPFLRMRPSLGLRCMSLVAGIASSFRRLHLPFLASSVARNPPCMLPSVRVYANGSPACTLCAQSMPMARSASTSSRISGAPFMISRRSSRPSSRCSATQTRTPQRTPRPRASTKRIAVNMSARSRRSWSSLGPRMTRTNDICGCLCLVERASGWARISGQDRPSVPGSGIV